MLGHIVVAGGMAILYCKLGKPFSAGSDAGSGRKEGILHSAGMYCRNAEWWSGIRLSFCSLILLNGCISLGKHAGAHVFARDLVTSALFWAM